jgi:hypothetical protein
LFDQAGNVRPNCASESRNSFAGTSLMDWLGPAALALFSTSMLIGPVNVYLIGTEGKPRLRAMFWLLLWLSVSALFALAAESAPQELGGVSVVIYIGLSLFFAYHAIHQILFLIGFGHRSVRVDDSAVYVLGLDLRVPWEQLVSIEVDHAGLKLTTTLARTDWFVAMPQAKAKAAVDAVVSHPNYRKLDPYVNVN